MRRALAFALALAPALAVFDACGSDGAAPAVGVDGSTADGAHDDAAPGSDAGSAPDADDPRCATQPVALPTHPFSPSQASDMGKCLRNVRGFHGRVYVGYGDLNANTGPVEVTSFDPATKTWADHLQLSTESIERYVVIDDTLIAPCSDAHGPESAACEFGAGTAQHVWSSHDFAETIHLLDATERVPGEVLMVGSSFLDDAGDPGAFVWRSLDGGAFVPIFPDGKGSIERGGGPFGSAASLNGFTFAVTNSSVWVWDGTGWTHARTPANPTAPVLLGEFLHPVVVAGHIVFATFGNYLFAFDGTTTTPLGLRTIDTPTQAGFYETPIPILEEAEGHLLLVDDRGRVLESTDLVHFACIGRAPADVRGIGAMSGIVYFGGADGHFYAYAQPSW